MSDSILNTNGQNEIGKDRVFVGAKNNNGQYITGFTDKIFVFDLENLPTEPFVNEIRATFNDKFVTDYFGNSAVVSTGYGIIYKELTPLLSTTIDSIFLLDNCPDNSQLYLNVYNKDFTRQICDTSKGTCTFTGGYGTSPNSCGHSVVFTNGLHVSANTTYQIPIAVVKVHVTGDNNNHLIYATDSDYTRKLTFFFDANNVLNNLSNALIYTTTDHPELYVYVGVDEYRT